MIFDNTTIGGMAPSRSRTLPAGTYDYAVRDSVSNDLACQLTSTVSDSFDYSFRLTVQP